MADLERTTFNLTPKAYRDLAVAVELGGENKTVTLHRAIALYAYVQTLMQSGGTLMAREADGESYVLKFF